MAPGSSRGWSGLRLPRPGPSSSTEHRPRPSGRVPNTGTQGLAPEYVFALSETHGCGPHPGSMLTQNHSGSLGLEGPAPGPAPRPELRPHTRHQLPPKLVSILPHEPRGSLLLLQFCNLQTLVPISFCDKFTVMQLRAVRAQTDEPGCLGSTPPPPLARCPWVSELAPDVF